MYLHDSCCCRTNPITVNNLQMTSIMLIIDLHSVNPWPDCKPDCTKLQQVF